MKLNKTATIFIYNQFQAITAMFQVYEATMLLLCPSTLCTDHDMQSFLSSLVSISILYTDGDTHFIMTAGLKTYL